MATRRLSRIALWSLTMLIVGAGLVHAAVSGPVGDRIKLPGLHPSFDLVTVRPPGFEPRVAGMDFLSDGRLVISTWDAEGAVYILDGVLGDDPNAITVKKIASGLYEPLGLAVVDDEIFVLQKHELVHLIDHDGDEIIDEYRTFSDGWGATTNFHEFDFGLVYKDGYFYATLATGILPGGASMQPQNPDRGKVIRISAADGSYEFIAHGLRVPNGIGIGVDGEIFLSDNQGDWLPSSKIVHLKEGAFYGSRAVDYEGTEGLEATPPVVWLPQGEIGNSPTQPLLMKAGPYAGQMIHGDIHHGGLKRVFVEKINGVYQGAVFRFTQGLEAGINRMVWGPDGNLYVGGLGSYGNWSHDSRFFGLQRLSYNGKTTFEMLAVRAKTNGMEIEFTEPLAPGHGEAPEDYQVQQWWYLPTARYGGPKMDLETLEVKTVTLSADRRRVFLEIDNLKEGHVVYIRVASPVQSVSGQYLWGTESWYTLNEIPEYDYGIVRPVAVAAAIPDSGPAPLTVQFDPAGSRDPQGLELSYRWDFGDGTGSDEARPVHTYTAEGTYTATLTVVNAQGNESYPYVLPIVVGNTLPQVEIASPVPGALVFLNGTLSLRADARDAEDGPLAGDRLVWTVTAHVQRGREAERAVLGRFTGASAEVVIPETYSWDDDVRFIVELQAIDSAGGVRTAERTVRFTRLQAEAADVMSGFRVEPTSDEDGVAHARTTADRAVLAWRGVNLTGRHPAFVRVAPAEGEARLTLRLGAPDGEILGEAVVQGERGVWQTAFLPAIAQGVHDLYLVVESGSAGVLINWLQLVGPGS